MRFLLFEELIERHVRDSLTRALQQLGHEVFAPEAFWRGGKFPEIPADIALSRAALESALAWEPDVLVNFRPAAITPDALKMLAERNIFTMVWFYDDPVFYNTVYKEILDSYDLILHCGSERILSFYQERHGFSGINCPFWTDSIACPPQIDSEKTFDVVFLGNCAGPVRSARYDTISSLDADVRILGKVEEDHASLSLGYEKDHELAMSKVGMARVGFSIPQFFENYQRTDLYFDGLGELGFFEIPSRIVQYAASGLPIVSLSPAPAPAYFPEIMVGRTLAECNECIRLLLADAELRNDVSRRTLSRFQRNYSARSRAKMMQYLASNKISGKEYPLDRRLRFFEEFEG